jgi:uncharacterized damage-inducible protein DinB
VHTADLQTLWAYHAWANRQIVAAAASLPAPALQTPVASGHGTLFATLLHMLDADYGWRMLLQHNTETPVLSEVDVPDLATLAERFLDEAAAMRAYMAALTDAALAEPLRDEVNGQQREQTRWQLLFHLVNHGTYHRGEVAAALTALGASPGELDFTVFLSRQPTSQT